MKVSAMIVASLDGKLTRGEERDIYQWASPEDGVYFKKYRSEADVIVMGRRTYETIKKTVDLSMKAVRVVMTHSPEKYHNDEIPDKLVFTSESPRKILEQYTKKGLNKMLVVGGPGVFMHFFQEKCIDEVVYTLEPLIFGKGNDLVLDRIDIKFELIESRRLNKQGTLFLRYKVIK